MEKQEDRYGIEICYFILLYPFMDILLSRILFQGLGYNSKAQICPDRANLNAKQAAGILVESKRVLTP